MPGENMAVIQTLLGAFLRRDAEVTTALMSPDVEWDTTRLAAWLPELAGHYHGLEGTRAFWSDWLSSWRDLRFDHELRAAGEQVVVLIRNQRQWGRTSGVETEVPDYAWVYTVRDGRVVHGCFYDDHDAALEALGLSG